MTKDSDALSLLAALATGSSHRALGEGDWSRVADVAIAERLAPLVYWKQKSNPSLPGIVAERLRRELYRTSAVNQILFRELALLLEAARARDLDPVIVLKGAALAASLYDDMALRPMGDVDLLVKRESVDALVELARELGYGRTHPEMGSGLREKVRYHVALENARESTAKLEVHWQLVAGDADSRAPEIDWFHRHTTAWQPPARVEEAPFPTYARELDPTASLLYLSAHAVLQHGLSSAPLIWLHDIHLVVTRRGEAIDWDGALEQARRFGWSDALALSLARARELFDTPIPGPALSKPRSAPKPASASRAEWVWRELGFVRFPERVRWMLAILFPRPAYVKWRYPGVGWLWPTCYPYRWYVVASEGSRAILRRIVSRLISHGDRER